MTDCLSQDASLVGQQYQKRIKLANDRMSKVMDRVEKLGYDATYCQEDMDQILGTYETLINDIQHDFTRTNNDGQGHIFFVNQPEKANQLSQYVPIHRQEDHYGRTPLFFVQNTDMIGYFAGLGYELDKVDEHGRNVLFFAQSPEIADYFMMFGVSPELDHYGRSPLFQSPTIEMVNYWMQHGFGIMDEDNYGRTALFFAQNLEVCQFLEEMGLEHKPNYQGELPVYYCASVELYQHMAEKTDVGLIKKNDLLARAVNPAMYDYLWREVMGERYDHCANCFRDVFHNMSYKIIAELLDMRAPILGKLRTPALVQHYISKGVAPSLESMYLHAYSLEMCKLFQIMGADINFVMRDGKNALYYSQTVDIAQWFLSQGLDPLMVDNHGQTVLFTLHNPKVIDFFLQFGLDLDQRDTNGYPAVYYSPNPEYLLSCGASVDVPEDGNVPTKNLPIIHRIKYTWSDYATILYQFKRSKNTSGKKRKKNKKVKRTFGRLLSRVAKSDDRIYRTVRKMLK